MSSPSSQSESLIERLFSAGAHFGFSKSRRHPSVSKYIFTHKDGNDIFDLEKTAVLVANAQAVLTEAGAHGKNVLFVSTKDEAAPYVKAAAAEVAMPYVTNRWIGGMLTNYSEIKKRIERMKALLAERESGELERKYTKKERVMIGREIDKLEFNFSGFSQLERLPDFMLVVDPRHDAIAVQEAHDAKVPVIAIMSSDCDASKVTYPVLVNDAHKASITLALKELTAAYAEGRKNYTAPTPRSFVRTTTDSSRTERPRRPRPTTARG
jgi:small subunit ribosomal protein S2